MRNDWYVGRIYFNIAHDLYILILSYDEDISFSINWLSPFVRQATTPRNKTSQSAFTCSKSAMKTAEQCVKSVQRRHRCIVVLLFPLLALNK